MDNLNISNLSFGSESKSYVEMRAYLILITSSRVVGTRMGDFFLFSLFADAKIRKQNIQYVFDVDRTCHPTEFGRRQTQFFGG